MDKPNLKAAIVELFAIKNGTTKGAVTDRVLSSSAGLLTAAAIKLLMMDSPVGGHGRTAAGAVAG